MNSIHGLQYHATREKNSQFFFYNGGVISERYIWLNKYIFPINSMINSNYNNFNHYNKSTYILKI